MASRLKIGLALGSGGWRGLAHIGVIKSLIKHNIPIDCIAGTSAGALIGGLYAALGSVEPIEQFFQELSYRKLLYAFSDPRPRSGLFKGDKAIKILDDFCHGATFKQTNIPFTAVAADVQTGRQINLKQGKLARAIRASTSVPLVFQPINYQGKKLVDGAVINPLPVRETQDLGADIVIAVDLYKNVFPWHPDHYSPLQVALKTSQLMLKELSRRNGREADLVIRPDVNESLRYRIFTKFVGNQETIQIGADAMNNNIETLSQIIEQ